jgi:hypothetical protein
MKFACGKSAGEKFAAKKEWHEWFAWYPVSVGSHDCRWLETVECQYYDLDNKFVRFRAIT